MARMNRRAHVVRVFGERFGHPPAGVARAPGRVNLLGEHVDYNDGWVLPVAIDRATYVAFGPADADSCEVSAADFGQQARFSFADSMARRMDIPEWARYPAGVAWSLGAKGLKIEGLQAVIASQVPRGAGLSSSASVELAFAVAWQSLGGWRLKPMDMALTCQRAENEFVGVKCGIMDQATSACGEAGRLLVLDCRSLTYQTLALPAEAAIIIADTGVRHSLSTSAYNSRRAACEEAVARLKGNLPGITALRDVRLADFNRLSSTLPDEVQRRARHVVEEIERTRQAMDMLGSGDLGAFGRLMNESHASLRDLYEVSCPELDAMAHIAQSLKGCYGARLTGAGFGGCTVNLVERRGAAAFTQDLGRGYAAETGQRAEIYVCSAAAGAGLD